MPQAGFETKTRQMHNFSKNIPPDRIRIRKICILKLRHRRRFWGILFPRFGVCFEGGFKLNLAGGINHLRNLFSPRGLVFGEKGFKLNGASRINSNGGIFLRLGLCFPGGWAGRSSHKPRQSINVSGRFSSIAYISPKNWF